MIFFLCSLSFLLFLVIVLSSFSLLLWSIFSLLFTFTFLEGASSFKVVSWDLLGISYFSNLFAFLKCSIGIGSSDSFVVAIVEIVLHCHWKVVVLLSFLAVLFACTIISFKFWNNILLLLLSFADISLLIPSHSSIVQDTVPHHKLQALKVLQLLFGGS